MPEDRSVLLAALGSKSLDAYLMERHRFDPSLLIHPGFPGVAPVAQASGRTALELW